MWQMSYISSRNHTFLVSRHNRVVNAIIDGIKSKRVPLPVGRRNNNLPTDGKIPDVEFYKNCKFYHVWLSSWVITTVIIYVSWICNTKYVTISMY